MDNTFSWKIHVDSLCSRLQQRIYFLRRLRLYGVNQRIMFLFYQAVLESLVRYSLSAWYGNLSAQLKSKLVRLIAVSMKVMGKREYQPLQSLYDQSVLRPAQRILADPAHVLYSEYNLLPSGRRYRVPRCKLNRFKNSFVPHSIKLLNSTIK